MTGAAEEAQPNLDTSAHPETLPLTRGPVGSTLAEDASFINVREVGDWAKESREYKPPLLSCVTLFTLSLGLLAGFVPAFAATDVRQHGGWWGIFLCGSVLGVLLAVLSLLAMVVELPWLAEKLSRVKRPTPLERLADRMERACQGGLLRAAAADAALRREEEKAREPEPVK